MAQSTKILYTSDLSGDDIEEADPTVSFGLDGTTYEIDLTADEAAKLRDALAEYVAQARKSARPGRRTKAPAPPASDASAVRAWAEINGYDVPARGRLPREIRDAYAAAN